LDLRKLLLAVSVLAGASCASVKRAGTDVAIVGTSPLTIPLAAVHDSLNWGEDTGSAASMVLLPFNVPLHALKHVAYTVCYGVDLVFAPVYLLASISPDRGLEPIDLYCLRDGYPWRSAPWPALED
jgi:hypothetical protein